MIVTHFIDVGQGNMTLVEMPDSTVFLYDCNITDDNAERVLKYVSSALRGRPISFFVNSHREADHMRGLKRLSKVIPIRLVCDNGLPGGTIDTAEYTEYMDVRRNAAQFTVAWNQIFKTHRAPSTPLWNPPPRELTPAEILEALIRAKGHWSK